MEGIIKAGTEVKHAEKGTYANVVGLSEDAVVADFGDGVERVPKGMIEIVR